MIPRPSRGFRRLSVTAVVSTYLLIVAGGVVRVTGSGLGCGTSNDWPLCAGGLLPPLRQDALIEFTHRWLAAIATTLVVALVAVAWLRYRRTARVVWPATAALAFFIVQIILGALTVKLSLPGSVVLVHLANATLLLGALVYIAFAACTVGTERGERFAAAGGWAGPESLAVAAAAATYAVVLSGALVVARGAGYACAAWPLCGDGFHLGSGEMAAFNVAHRVVVGITAVLVVLSILHLRRAAPSDRHLRWVGLMSLALLAAQVAAGALVVELRLPAAARGLHLALASALWAVLLLFSLMARAPVPALATGRRSATGDSRARSGVAAS